MVDVDSDFCFPCSSCLAKFCSLRELRKHVCRRSHDDTQGNKRHKTPTEVKDIKFIFEENTFNNFPSLQQSLKKCNKGEQQGLPKYLPQENVETVLEVNPKTATKPRGTLALKDVESECAPCKKVFSRQIIYLRHRWEHKKYELNTRKYKETQNDCLPCTEHDCSEVFRKPENLEFHKAKVHGIQKVFKCNICPYSSKNKLVFKIHNENKHDQSNLNSYICNECGDGFKNKKNLDYHMKKKYGTYDYKCEECNYKTFVKDQLKTHMQTHGEKIFRFICSECGKGFTHRAYLKYHMSRHTGQRNFKCNFCEKSFRMKFTMTHHEKIHLNIRPYQCNMCPKKFRGHNNHKVHIMRHLNQKEYVCSRCERGFIEPAGLRHHSCPKK